jgi:type I restriction enzyme S subunit
MRYGVYADQTFSFVREDEIKGLRVAEPGDLVIATTSEDIEGVGNAVVWLGQQNAYVSGETHIFRHGQNPKYLGYFFRSEDFQRAKLSMLTGTKVKRISMKSLGKIVAPIPPLPVQEEIVRILDTFTELEAELEAELSLASDVAQKIQPPQANHHRDMIQ